MTDKGNLICHYPSCRQNFLAMGMYSLQHVCFPQEDKDICTYFQIRYGYDYYIRCHESRKFCKEVQYG